MSLSLSFPDSTYTSANKPSVETLKTDVASIETDVNAHEASAEEHGATGAVVGTTNPQTLTNKTLTSPVLNTSLTGTALQWNDWSPSYTGITVGNGTLVARYAQIQKTVHYSFLLTLGSTSTIGASQSYTLPVPKSSTNPFIALNIEYRDSSTFATYIGCSNGYQTSSLCVATVVGSYLMPDNITTTKPFTWGTGDQIYVHGIYEAA